MIVIGIDPGLDGAIAALRGNAAEAYDTPTAKDGKKRRYLLADMRRIILALASGQGGNVVACIERVHSMPKQGVASSFSFGEGFGIWQGLIVGIGVPFDLVTPQAWKKAMMAGAAKDKDASRIVAQRLFPTVELNLKRHHGRADALLIAEYRRRMG